jgi:hypothetical protein
LTSFRCHWFPLSSHFTSFPAPFFYLFSSLSW